MTLPKDCQVKNRRAEREKGNNSEIEQGEGLCRGEKREDKPDALNIHDLDVLGWRSIENNEVMLLVVGDKVEILDLLLGAKGNWKGFKQKNICV